MPELPEVETVRRGLVPVMEGARFVRVEQRRPDLRFPFPRNFNKRLEGATVEGLSRRAKYLLADLSSGEVLLMHLGMSGSFRVVHGSDESGPGKFHHVRGKLSAHDHVVFHMSNGAIVTFNDPRRFGYMKLIARDELARHPMISGLAPEPLGNAFDGAMLAEACAGKKTSLKAALSDQKVVAGLGNIYVCEALHRAHLSPKRIAATIADRKRRTDRARQCAGRLDPCGAERCDPRGRLVAARSSPDRRRPRLFPAFVPRLRPRGREMSDPALQGHDQAHRAGDAEHVLLSGVPEMNLTSSGGARARLEGWRQTPKSAAILGSGCALTPQDERLSPFHVNRLYASTIRSSDAADESCMPAWIARIRKEAPCCWGFEAEAENTPAARAKGRGYVCIP